MTKKRGWGYYAKSLIVTTDNNMTYLNTSYEQILQMLADDSDEIYVETSSFYGRGGFALKKNEIATISKVF